MAARRPLKSKASREALPELPPHVAGLVGAEAADLLHALHQPPPVSIRWNPAKHKAADGEQVPWCAQGRYLPERPVFTLDPLLHSGAYYVQEAASMLLEQALKACVPMPSDAVVLDLCAAPGGKSTHLAALLPRQALLISNEVVRARQAPLTENLWKWGRHDCVVTAEDPQDFLPMGPFCDLLVVDAPCSGEGMFRKDPHARDQWGPNLVRTCAARQSTILGHAWNLLKPGGYLVYSTCTWETAENEDQVEGLVRKGAELLHVPVQGQWGVVQTAAGIRCYPHRVRGEGFFMALLRKPMEAMGPAGTTTLGRPMSAGADTVRQWLRNGDGFALLEHRAVLHAIGTPWAALATALAGAVQVLAPGIPVALRKGDGWQPHPALALNAILDPSAFPAMDLGVEQTLRYLRGEAMPATGASGTALVRCNGLGLGWANGAGNRWNNLWPAEWRIRMR